MAAGDPGLRAWLHDRIRQSGPMPFARFMEAALYHPAHGYYCRPGASTGRTGDFYTSPDVHPAFGWLLSRQVAEILDRAVGRSDGPCRIVEAGPGTGTLARDIIDGLARENARLASRCVYTLVEISPSLRRLQQETLRDAGSDGKVARVEWREWSDLVAGGAGDGFRGCVVANEFLDALPVHVLELRGGRLQEVHVSSDGDRFGEVLLEVSDPRILRHARELRESEGVDLREGQRAEFGLAGLDWIADAGRMFGDEGRGGLILIDYGYPTAEIYDASRGRGTLMCYHRHRAVEDPYERLGEQDITAHLDFGSLVRRAVRSGFDAAPLRSQMMFLVSLGLPRMLAEIASRPAQGVGEVRDRLALHGLMTPGGMGEIFKVLLLTRGTCAADLTGAGDPFRQAAFSQGEASREGEPIEQS